MVAFGFGKNYVLISECVETRLMFLSLRKTCGLAQESSDVSSIQTLIRKYWKKFHAIKKTSFWDFFSPFFFIFLCQQSTNIYLEKFIGCADVCTDITQVFLVLIACEKSIVNSCHVYFLCLLFLGSQYNVG